MYDFQENYTQQAAEREKAVYDKLVAQFHQLLYAADEGVFEITVRSLSGPITVAVANGSELTQYVVEALSKQIGRIETNLNRTVAEMGSEVKSELRKKEQVAATRETQTLANQAAYYGGQAFQQPEVAPVQPRRAASRRAAAMPLPMNQVGVTPQA